MSCAPVAQAHTQTHTSLVRSSSCAYAAGADDEPREAAGGQLTGAGALRRRAAGMAPGGAAYELEGLSLEHLTGVVVAKRGR